ncbi:MAG: transketolase [Actinomycetota bacterium]
MTEKIASHGTELDLLSINTIRTLAMDAVEKATCGHPGAPMGMAPMAYVLWTRYLKHNPQDPTWPDRDRFILSAGHASLLLYSLLHLTGYDLSLDDIKDFRQWGSRTPGHPEYRHTPGVETTTGPLGQGFANGVGMAMAERMLAERFNRSGFNVVDHYTYCICSDGDLMEGISSEAASLAGHLKLGKLVYLYDSNHITIDGTTDLAFTENVPARFAAYGWHVQEVTDGNDLDALDAAIAAGRQDPRPSLIAVTTHIGYGAPTKQDTPKAHGAALGAEEVAAAKTNLGWDPQAFFLIPDAALENYRQAVQTGQQAHQNWSNLMSKYQESFPDEAAEFSRCQDGCLPEGWDAELPDFKPDDGPMATRKASGKSIAGLAGRLPELVGGSADLAESNLTDIPDGGEFSATESGRNIHFGVREHGMGGLLNGMAIHGGVRPFGGTFLIFSDYMRGSIRLAALMKAPVIYVFTHDSVGLGEDGPTHEPIEHVASLRAIPTLVVMRPADATETAEAWRTSLTLTEGRPVGDLTDKGHGQTAGQGDLPDINKGAGPGHDDKGSVGEIADGPVALCLTRQNLPVFDRTQLASATGVSKGAYVLLDPSDSVAPDLILIGTGSEVSLALEAAQKLTAEGINARVVSMPSWELFERQSQSYRNEVLPPSVRARVSIEAGTTLGWERWIGDEGKAIGVDHFGASAPGAKIMEEFGFSPDNVVETARRVYERTRGARPPI